MKHLHVLTELNFLIIMVKNMVQGQRKIPIKKNCADCGKEFLAKNNVQKYCCRVYSKKAITKELTCPICQTKFYTDRVRKYCSEKCSKEFRMRQIAEESAKRKAEKPELTCDWCKGKFKAKCGNYARFCCEEHRAFYHKAKRRIYMTFPFEHEKSDKAQAELREKGMNFMEIF